jgi:uncharacterized protein (TIGR00297 family)
VLLTLTYSFLFSAAIAAIAYWRGSLARSGAVAALLVGTFTFGFGGLAWGILLGVFFVSSSLLSHFKEEEKREAAEKFDKSHRRDFGQVLANGGLGSLIAALSIHIPSAVWFPLFVGVMASVTADTWATEIGTLSRQRPRLITSGRRVDVGTSGAVSPMGTAVSAAGGLLVGLSAGLLVADLTLGTALLIGLAGGLAGSLFDSLLGATVQRVYYCETCQKETERRIHRGRHQTRPLRGWPWLNNDLVNLISSAVGGLVAVGLMWLIHN